jgi:hypothetical protein
VETASVLAVRSYDARLLASVAKEVLKNRGDRSKAQGSKSLSYCFREIERRENRESHGLWVPFMKGGAVYYVLATNFAQICLTKRAAGLKKSDELVVYG